jgi:gag-polyprotein putative aspartyl protease
MGIVYQHIRLSNFARPEIDEVDAKALVDTGALELCISPLIAKQLKLTKVEDRKVTLASGETKVVDYVGPVTGALVLGEGVLLGAVPMESMDVLIDPARLRLIPNPDNPTIPGALAMGVRPVRKADNA